MIAQSIIDADAMARDLSGRVDVVEVPHVG
jgi:hypothetical protein